MSSDRDSAPGRGQNRSGTAAVIARIEPRETDLGDFSVRRLLPHRRQRQVGPWVFFDHFGPVDFDPGRGIDVRPHPHINLATVTYLFDGEILHRDSLGSEQTISPGAINLMIAGKGIVHSERERPAVRATRHSAHGLQLWLGLPEASEEIDPEFLHYPADAIPAKAVDGVPVTVMIGSAYGLQSPVRTFADTLFVEAHLTAGQRLDLPEADELALYVVAGRVGVGDDEVAAHSMAVLDPGARTPIRAGVDAHIVLIGGEPIGERFIDWNFVSSRRDRIERAKQDWRDGRFPTVPGDRDEFIPLPD
ncbi:MAG: pirin family protein [Gammaproteobacteria bacterium]|nr:pirin family protein [Gammaproteobacteria bacterium]